MTTTGAERRTEPTPAVREAPAPLALAGRGARVMAIVAVTLVPAVVAGLVRTATRGRTAGRRYLYRRTAVL
ncbi:hypothetical protein AB0C69_35790, partial [Actinomadura sp. NPDC048032]